jgi:sporulation protein YlmC with PRC-barrel domain
MKRTLVAAAAVSFFALSPALAQYPPSPNMATDSSVSQPVTEQRPDQWLFSKFNGTDVIGTDDNKIGDVNDVLFDKSGKVDALIVGVGGFLGLGSKDVALPVKAFQVVPGTNGTADKLRLSTTKDQLKQMAEFKPLTKASTTTGAGGQMGGSSK